MNRQQPPITDRELKACLAAGPLECGLGEGLAFVAGATAGQASQASWSLRLQLSSRIKEQVLERPGDSWDLAACLGRGRGRSSDSTADMLQRAAPDRSASSGRRRIHAACWTTAPWAICISALLWLARPPTAISVDRVMKAAKATAARRGAVRKGVFMVGSGVAVNVSMDAVSASSGTPASGLR